MLLFSITSSSSSRSGSECDSCIDAVGTMTGISKMAVTWSFVCDEDEIEKEEEEEEDFVVTLERGRVVVCMNDCIPRQKVAAVRRRNAVVTKTPFGGTATEADNIDDFRWLGFCELRKRPAHASARATAAIHIVKNNMRIQQRDNDNV